MTQDRLQGPNPGGIVRPVPLLLLLATLGTGACNGDSSTETGETGDTDPTDTQETGTPTETGETGETGRDTAEGDYLPLQCNEDYIDAPAEVPPPSVSPSDPDLVYHVVEIDTDEFEHLFVAVFFPVDSEVTAYEEGAPPLVVAVPSMEMQSGTVAGRVSADYGLVELQPLYPSWEMDGNTTSGAWDAGGEQSALALRETVLFAADRLTTVEGWSLGHLVERPVCNGQVVMVGNSRGAVTGTTALARWHDELSGVLVGYGTHEPPTVPQFVVGDGGWIWMDSDADTDADGNGISWDDARNRTYQEGGCEPLGSNCTLDYTNLKFTLDVTLADIRPEFFDPVDGENGMLFLDNDGDGAFTWSGNTTDVDGDGAVNEDEDFYFAPFHEAAAPAGQNVQYYSNEVLGAAVDQNVLDEATWPTGLATASQAQSFWATRNLMGGLGDLSRAWDSEEIWFGVEYTAVDHANALSSRPHIYQIYEGLRQAGYRVRYNTAEAMAECLLEPAYYEGWAGEVEAGVEIPEGDLQEWAFPAEMPNTVARVLSGVGLIWDLFGPFDRCPQ